MIIISINTIRYKKDAKLKTVDFFNSVNVTLGLDFIRTSPDHGTAFDRAARLNARPDSLIAAIKFAENMALNAHEN